MSNHVIQPQNTFIVRIWWELQRGRSSQARGWHGRIEHVQSGEGTAFQDARQLIAFMQRFVAPLESQATGDAASEMEEGKR